MWNELKKQPFCASAEEKTECVGIIEKWEYQSPT